MALYLAVRPPRSETARRLVAMVLLLLAKLATIAVPFTFKWATDALAGQGRRAPLAVSESGWSGRSPRRSR